MKQECLDWLLGFEEPSLTYRILTELLDKPEDDPEVVKAKSVIPESKAVRRIFAKMHPGHYWLEKDYKGQLLGDDRHYCTQTTHFVLGYLASWYWTVMMNALKKQSAVTWICNTKMGRGHATNPVSMLITSIHS